MRRSQHTRSFVSMALWRGVLFRDEVPTEVAKVKLVGRVS
jgi:hypothetical protein